ncbi:MAG: MarR family transcriptional regulator [Actinobacteria bacterium]|nr:MarR family transcriptional regulator [Actinomycetota bacterium]
MATSTSDQRLVETWDVISTAFARTQRRLLATVEAAGLPGPWFEALRLLMTAEDHRLPMSRLARDLSMTAGGLTKLADRMARDGLIDRRNSSDDRRVVYAALTPRGTELASEAIELYHQGLRDHVLQVLPRAQLTELAAMMEKLRDAHSDVPAADEELTARDPALPDRRGRGPAI